DADVEVLGVVEKGARVTADGDRVWVADDGKFTLHFDRPPVGSVIVEARDRAGNVTTATLVVPITTPGMRGVHVTGPAWSNEGLRGGTIALGDHQGSDTAELDLKDGSGPVVSDSNVARASETGALHRQYDLDSAITTLHSRGIRVVGRISAFRDPILARAA